MQVPARLRPGVGLVTGFALLAAGVAVLLPFRDSVDRAVPALLLVLPVLAGGALGGRGPAVVTAVAAATCVNVFFLPPYNTFRISLRTDAIALAAFLAVAMTVGALAAELARRQRSSEQKAAEIEAMQAELSERDHERRRFEGEAARLRLLEQVDEQRAALLRSVSHDLRTPLATIQAITSDLRSGSAAYDEAESNELLDLVASEAERLDRLVANLLSLSRIEAGAWQPARQATDLDDLLRDRIRRLSGLFGHTRVVLDVDHDLPLVNGDYVQLEQVFTNLLENAARHAPPRSTVTVRAAPSPGRRSSVRVAVADEGIGVAKHEQRRVFEAFRRGEGSTSSGIGLAICRAVVEAHDGTIAVEDTPGGGATFVVTLPAWSDGRG